jgi:hypothetical protein
LVDGTEDAIVDIHGIYMILKIPTFKFRRSNPKSSLTHYLLLMKKIKILGFNSDDGVTD